jgi:hypothetical protein
MFTWGGRFHPVPEGFRFPKGTPQQYWNLYFYGHKGLRYKPYKDIKGHDLFAKSDKTLMCKAKKVIFKIIEYAGLNSPVDVNNLSSAAADKVFQDGLLKLYRLFNSTLVEDDFNILFDNITDLAYTSVYDKIMAYEKAQKKYHLFLLFH